MIGRLDGGGVPSVSQAFSTHLPRASPALTAFLLHSTGYREFYVGLAEDEHELGLVGQREDCAPSGPTSTVVSCEPSRFVLARAG